jgi:hypothetical protein
MSVWTVLRALLSGLQSRSQLLLENIALRPQLTVPRRFSRSAKMICQSLLG